ncbi:proprotein convertase P-domain-containing protein [bacterium]|nr:proprotein convertase P-domain-containing protein [bacterium]
MIASRGVCCVVAAVALVCAPVSATVVLLVASSDADGSFGAVPRMDHQAAAWNASGFWGPALDELSDDLPLGADIDAIAFLATGEIAFSLDADAWLAGIPYADEDVILWSGSTYSMFWDGSANGLPRGADLDALYVMSESPLKFYFSTDSTVRLSLPSGDEDVADEDVVKFEAGSGFVEVSFDGTAKGISPNVNLNAMSVSDDGMWALGFDSLTQFLPASAGSDVILEYDPSTGTISSEPIYTDSQLGLATSAEIDALELDISRLNHFACEIPPGTLAIPDNDPAGAMDSLSIVSSDVIVGLAVSLTAYHGRVGDLVISLRHEDTGTSITLLDRPGAPYYCEGDDIDVILDDSALQPAQFMCNLAPPAISGILSPWGNLGSFAGETIGGDWTLAVSDRATGEAGYVTEWCLIPETVPPTPTPTPSPTPPPILLCAWPPAPIDIPDNLPAGVADSFLVPDSGAILDLDVMLMVDHSFVGDLVVTLRHEETGREITLLDRPGVPGIDNWGCPGDGLDVILSDEAQTLAEDECQPSGLAMAGEFRPNEALAAFDGEDVFGVWTLNVSDHVSKDTGVLFDWCLQYSFVPGAPTPTPSPTASPTPTPVPPPVPGDENGDGQVTLFELNAAILGFRGIGPVPPSADTDHDTILSIAEMNAVVIAYRTNI